jgi:hypothetical protein
LIFYRFLLFTKTEQKEKKHTFFAYCFKKKICLAEQPKAERHFDSVTGMDAQVSYAFHSERKLHPEKFKNQMSNQVN